MINDKYDPPNNLNSYELNVIGQALVSDISNQTRQLKSLGLLIKDYCTQHGGDPAEVLTRELASLRLRYDVMCKFTLIPMEWEFYEKIIREGWVFLSHAET